MSQRCVPDDVAIAYTNPLRTSGKGSHQLASPPDIDQIEKIPRQLECRGKSLPFKRYGEQNAGVFSKPAVRLYSTALACFNTAITSLWPPAAASIKGVF